MSVAVMGVVNVTPDSFVLESRTPDVGDAIDRCHRLIAEGAAIIDIGGESTRPGATPVTVEQESARVLPVVEAIAAELPAGVAISIDTRHEAVARAAVAAGATIVNDMSASLGAVAGDMGVGYVAGHMQGTPGSMQNDPKYDDVIQEVLAKVVDAAETANAAGSPRVWIDPGIGFGKTTEHNLELLAHIDRIVAAGLPVLVGVSRKSLVGRLHAASDQRVELGQATAVATADRLEGSLAIAVWSAALGVEVLRVHDVSSTVQALKVVAARITV